MNQNDTLPLPTVIHMNRSKKHHADAAGVHIKKYHNVIYFPTVTLFLIMECVYVMMGNLCCKIT